MRASSHEWTWYLDERDPREFPVPSIKGGHRQRWLYKPGSRFSPDTGSALDLGPPTSRTVRSKFLLSLTHPVYGLKNHILKCFLKNLKAYFVIAAPADWDLSSSVWELLALILNMETHSSCLWPWVGHVISVKTRVLTGKMEIGTHLLKRGCGGESGRRCVKRTRLSEGIWHAMCG